jgi:hypothetical protein
MAATWSRWVYIPGPRTTASPSCGSSRYVRRADCLTFLTQARLKDGSLRSGRASMTTKTHGPSTNSWQSSTVAHSRLPMTSRQKSRRDRATTSARHGTRAAQNRISTTSPYQLDRVACRRTRIGQTLYRPRTPPSLFPRPRPPSLPTRHPRHSSVDEQRRLPRSLLVRATLLKPTWPPKS